jgi:hypothetical protein
MPLHHCTVPYVADGGSCSVSRPQIESTSKQSCVQELHTMGAEDACKSVVDAAHAALTMTL